MGGAVFPPCYLTWGQTMVEVMKIMVTSFKSSHACTATHSAPNPVAGHRWPTPPLETPGHSQASLGQSLVGSLLLGPGAHKVLFVPSKSLFPQSCVSSGRSMVELMATSSKRAYAIPRTAAPRTPAPVAVRFWPIPPQETLKHLTCLLRNLCAGQEATVRTGQGTTDWLPIGKGICQGCILSPCLFNLYAEYIMRNAGLDEAQAGIKIAGRNINNLRYADDTTLMEESEEDLKSLLMKVKEESEKIGLKLSIQKTKIMASGPITSWQINGEIVETVRDLLFLGSKITADGDCNHEIKRRILLGRKVMTNLDSILKNRDITVPTKVRLVKAMVFPVIMYGCESWIIKKPECLRIDAFEMWCWRLLRVP